MTRTPPQPHAAPQTSRAGGISAVALGALVAVAVAALFLVLTGADRQVRWPRPGTTAPSRMQDIRGDRAVSPATSRDDPIALPGRLTDGRPLLGQGSQHAGLVIVPTVGLCPSLNPD